MIKTEVLSVKDPVWNDRVGGTIDCLVRFNTHHSELPFTASPDDCEAHGREIYWRCVLGEFGPVGQPVVRPEPPFLGANGDVGPSWLDKVPGFLEFLREANEENSRSSPRAIMLVWGSMLDHLISQILEDQNIKPKGKNFNSRIEALRAKKLLCLNDINGLHSIRELRNGAGHEWSLSFDYSPEWKDKALKHFKLLHDQYDAERVFYEDLDYLTRGVFTAAAGMLMMKLVQLL